MVVTEDLNKAVSLVFGMLQPYWALGCLALVGPWVDFVPAYKESSQNNVAWRSQDEVISQVYNVPWSGLFKVMRPY